jgi:predicted metalloprotease
MHRRRGRRALIGSSALALFLLAAACTTSDDGSATDATLKPGRGSGNTTTTDEASSTTEDTGSSTTEETTDPTSSGTTETTQAQPSDLPLEETVPLVVQSLTEYWTKTFPSISNVPYTPLSSDQVIAVRSANPRITCGGDVINQMILANGGNALYCSQGPDDLGGQYIAYDARGLIPQLYRRIGDMAVLVAIAHEWGHSISAAAHFDQETRTTIQSEQQADCFAGSWAGDVANGDNSVLSLSPGDLDEALTGLLTLRDPPQVNPQSEGAHGSAFQRIDAFRKGFEGGAGACAALHRQPPVDQGTDQLEGDLSLAELMPLTTQALDLFWTTAFGQLGGSTYATFTVASFRGSGQAPACSGLTADQVTRHILYCPATDSVVIDEDLVDDLYDQGDFAVSAAVADAWSAGILARLKVSADPKALGLDADCLAGAWTGALSRSEVIDPASGNPILTLSAGDLDEAVAGFLLQSGTAGASSSFDADATAAFDRTAAFQKGFETRSGPRTCIS